MTDLLDRLTGGDRRSIGRANEVAAAVLRDPSLFGALFAGLLHPDPLVRMRAADAAEKVTARRPDLLEPHRAELIGRAAEADQPEVRWHVAQMIPRLAWRTTDLPRVTALLLRYLADRSRIVQVSALQALADLVPQEPALLALLREKIESRSPALRSRARKLLERYPGAETPLGDDPAECVGNDRSGDAAAALDTSHPTPFPDLNALLSRLLREMRTLLGDRLVGLILFGSLTSGDFDPERSDVDLLVVTDGELPAEMLPALAAMHTGLTVTGGPWATRLESSYIPRRALRLYDPENSLHPALRVDGSFGVDRHGSEWVIQRHIIREHGTALAGPEPRNLIDPVSPDDLRQAALGTLHQWWQPQLEDHALLQSREYQAYAVLTMCRSLYTLRHGAIVSKPVAARWAMRELGGRWAELVESALAWPRGPQPDQLSQTLELIRYTLECGDRAGLAAPEPPGRSP